MKNTIISAVVSAIVAVAIVLSFGGGSSATPFGGQTGISGLNVGSDGITSSGDVSFTGDTTFASTTIDGHFEQGNGILSIATTSATYTLTESELLNSSVIEIDEVALAAALTLTTPATSTMSTLLDTAGERYTWIIENNHTGAATTTTIAAGTGVDLLENDGQNVVIGINNSAELTCWRKSDTDVGCIVNETIPAD